MMIHNHKSQIMNCSFGFRHYISNLLELQQFLISHNDQMDAVCMYVNSALYGPVLVSLLFTKTVQPRHCKSMVEKTQPPGFFDRIDRLFLLLYSFYTKDYSSGRTQDVATKQTNASTGATRRTRRGASEAAATGAAAAVALLSLVQLQSTRMTTFSTEHWSSLTTTKLLLLLYTFNNYRKQEGALLPSLLLVATQFGGQPPPRDGARLQSSGFAKPDERRLTPPPQIIASYYTTSLFLERVDSQSVK